MASSLIHNDIKKVIGLLVNAVHMVKSPASRKKFFLIKGEQKMDKEALEKKLKEEDKLSDDDIAFIMSNDNITKILMDDSNSKKALDVVKDGIRTSLTEMENALEGENISDVTSKMIKPLEQFTSFLSPSDVEGDGSDNGNGDGSGDSDGTDKELENSVLELTEEISGLAQDTADLAETIIEDE